MQVRLSLLHTLGETHHEEKRLVFRILIDEHSHPVVFNDCVAVALLVAPWSVVVLLLVFWAGSAIWSWRSFAERQWAPLVAGTTVAVCWIGALTVFA